MSDQPGQPPVPPEPPYPAGPPAEPAPPAAPYPPAEPAPPAAPYLPAEPAPPATPQPPQPYPPQPPQAPQPYPPQPPQPSQYPPQAYAPPAGQAYPPAAAAVPPAPVKKKRPVWLWVVIVIVLLLCCGATAVAGVIGFAAQGAANDAATIKKADAAYTKAIGGLETAADSLSVEEGADSAAMTEALGDSKAGLAEARAAISGLSESAGRTAYLQGIDEADKAIEALASVGEETSGKSRFLQVAKEAVALYEKGGVHINNSVSFSNKSQYRKAGVEAGLARTAFTQARAKLVEADAMEPAADLEKSIQYVDLQLKKVDYTIQLNNHGARGEISAYNKVVPKFNAVNAQINKLDEPDALTDPTWATRALEDLQGQFQEYLTKSGELIDKAHSLFSSSSSSSDTTGD